MDVGFVAELAEAVFSESVELAAFGKRQAEIATARHLDDLTFLARQHDRGRDRVPAVRSVAFDICAVAELAVVVPAEGIGLPVCGDGEGVRPTRRCADYPARFRWQRNRSRQVRLLGFNVGFVAELGSAITSECPQLTSAWISRRAAGSRRGSRQQPQRQQKDAK
jgi:hypothetical protein